MSLEIYFLVNLSTTRNPKSSSVVIRRRMFREIRLKESYTKLKCLLASMIGLDRATADMVCLVSQTKLDMRTGEETRFNWEML